MTEERDVLEFRCGRAQSGTAEAPTFNDLADARDRPLDARVGLLRAVELVRAIGGSQGCTRAPDLVIDDPADIADPDDRWVVALLVEAAGSRLFVGGCRAAAGVLDRHEELEYVLRLFAEVPEPARLKSRNMSGNWKQAAARYLCADLGLTGKHAAWAMNLVTSPGTFNEKSVRYYATKTKEIKGAIDHVRDMWGSKSMSISGIDGDDFQWYLGASIKIRLPEEMPSGIDRTLFHYAALIYNELQPDSLEIPATWPTPTLRTAAKQMIERAMRVVVPVRRRAYATRPWPPADPRRARTFAMKLANQGRSMRDIAAALDEQGYRVSRRGGWHYRSVTELLQQPQSDNL